VKRNRRKNKSAPSAQGQTAPIARSMQIDDDIAFHQRDWFAERIVWAVMALIVTAALLGLFSSGPLSAARSADPSGAMEVEYPRFLRLSAPAMMTLRLRRETAPADGFAFILDERFVETFRINSVVPPPVRSLAAGGGLRLEFASSGEPRATVTLHLEPIRFGATTPQVALPGGASVRLPAFVYP
jgi:hypothetical protein